MLVKHFFTNSQQKRSTSIIQKVALQRVQRIIANSLRKVFMNYYKHLERGKITLLQFHMTLARSKPRLIRYPLQRNKGDFSSSLLSMWISWSQNYYQNSVWKAAHLCHLQLHSTQSHQENRQYCCHTDNLILLHLSTHAVHTCPTTLSFVLFP